MFNIALYYLMKNFTETTKLFQHFAIFMYVHFFQVVTDITIMYLF